MQSHDIGGIGVRDPESQFTFVVYDKRTGTIHHIHQVINLPGAEVKNREQMERVALSHVPTPTANKHTDLLVLSVAPEQMERGKSYRVDPKRQILVAQER
jgi:hypothetical protein